MKTDLANNHIKLFASHSERKAHSVERLNRNIKGSCFDILQRKTRRFIDTLRDIASKNSGS